MYRYDLGLIFEKSDLEEWGGEAIPTELWLFAVGESPPQKASDNLPKKNLVLGGEAAFTRAHKAMYRYDLGFIKDRTSGMGGEAVPSTFS